MKTVQEKDWTLLIKPKTGWLEINFKEIWSYRDLLVLLVKRDWVTTYKQTVLGPLWAIAQPLFMTVVFTFVFNKVANISTNGAPSYLFYMCGLLPWNLFSSCFSKSSSTFIANYSLFGKVYFPRLIVPLSTAVSGFISFGINLLVFFIFYGIAIINGFKPESNAFIYFLPLLIILSLMFGIGLGLIVSSLTVKYRDLTFLSSFGLQLFMYATPIIYPLSIVSEKYLFWVSLNPMSTITEGFRMIFLGDGILSLSSISLCTLLVFLVFWLGVILYNKTEKSFIDIV